MNWQRLFKPQILLRGLDYYENGLVEVYQAGKDFVQAKVQGSSTYDVSIDIADGEILDMECECPYAQDGNNCKHMAAVLFFMDEESEDTPKEEEEKARNSERSMAQLVQTADEKTVRDFLTEILERDEKLLGRFKSILCCELSPKDMKRYRNLQSIYIENRLKNVI